MVGLLAIGKDARTHLSSLRESDRKGCTFHPLMNTGGREKMSDEVDMPKKA
jgi:hypothetical protein